MLTFNLKIEEQTVDTSRLISSRDTVSLILAWEREVDYQITVATGAFSARIFQKLGFQEPYFLFVLKGTYSHQRFVFDISVFLF